MLAQLVRPLVRTQLKLLADADSTQSRLVNMVAEWLGYLGVEARVTQLNAEGDQIQVSLCVARPEQCSQAQWQQILDNLQRDPGNSSDIELNYAQMLPEQQRKVPRLLACIIQAGDNEEERDWDGLKRSLASLNLSEPLLQGIRSALKVPGNLESLLPGLEPKAAAFVLSKAIAISLMDQKITTGEDDALKALYGVIETQAKE